MWEDMLDTNICIYVLRNLPIHLSRKFDERAGKLCISAITFGELCVGAEKSQRREDNMLALQHFTARLKILPFAASAARHYGQIRPALESAETPFGPLDTLIAAHARSEGLTLVTNNTREFQRVPGLRVENWV